MNKCVIKKIGTNSPHSQIKLICVISLFCVLALSVQTFEFSWFDSLLYFYIFSTLFSYARLISFGQSPCVLNIWWPMQEEGRTRRKAQIIVHKNWENLMWNLSKLNTGKVERITLQMRIQHWRKFLEHLSFFGIVFACDEFMPWTSMYVVRWA